MGDARHFARVWIDGEARNFAAGEEHHEHASPAR